MVVNELAYHWKPQSNMARSWPLKLVIGKSLFPLSDKSIQTVRSVAPAPSTPEMSLKTPHISSRFILATSLVHSSLEFTTLAVDLSVAVRTSSNPHSNNSYQLESSSNYGS